MPDERLDRLEAHLHEIDSQLAFLTMRVDALQAGTPISSWLASPVQPVASPTEAQPPSMGTAVSPRQETHLDLSAVPVPAPARSSDIPVARPKSKPQRSGAAPWPQRALDPQVAPNGLASAGASSSPRRGLLPPSTSWQELERAISERGLALAGGLALLIGAILFFSLAITRGWIGPEARVALGLVGGIALTLLGDRLLPTRNRVVGAVLVAVGIGVWQLALVAGARLYDVVPMWAALPGMLAAAAVATAFAIRANAQVVALYGLGTALAAPLLFGIPDAQIPIPYLAVMVAATAAIALARGWVAPPWLACLLSSYQLSLWAWPPSGASPDTAVLWLAALTVLHGLAALGMEWRTPLRFRASACLLVAANGAVYVSFLLALLWREAFPWLLGGAAAFVLLGIAGQRLAPAPSAGSRRRFALTAFAVAVIQVTIAVPVLLEGPVVECLWAIEALVLVWLATRFRERAGLAGAAIVFGLATLTAYFRASGSAAGSIPGLPFASPALVTLLVFLAVLGVACVIRHATTDRRVLIAIALLLVTCALPLHITGVGLVIGWAALAVLAVAGERLLPSGTGSAAKTLQQRIECSLLLGVGVLPAALAIERATTFEMPLTVSSRLAGAPYPGQPAVATVALVAAAAAAAAISQHAWVRQVAITVGIAVLAWFATFALPTAQTVIAWAILAILAERIRQRLPDRGPLLLGLSGVLLAMGVAAALADVAPLGNLVVSSAPTSFMPGDALLGLGALAAATLVLAWGLRAHQAGKWLAGAAATLLIYAVSLSVVATFQQNVNLANIDDLRRQAHMALSITWAVIGGLLLGAGVMRAWPLVRWYGLGLLGLATAKVFLYDLNSLDAIYRVLSFLVLGVVLLACATIYRRLDRPAGTSSP